MIDSKVKSLNLKQQNEDYKNKEPIKKKKTYKNKEIMTWLMVICRLIFYICVNKLRKNVLESCIQVKILLDFHLLQFLS